MLYSSPRWKSAEILSTVTPRWEEPIVISSWTVSPCREKEAARRGEKFFLLYRVGQIRAPRFHSYRKPRVRIARKANIR